MEKCYSELAKTIFDTCAGVEKVYYLANPGNWGDGLIREGAICFFKDYNIQYEEINFNSRLDLLNKDAVLIYGGNGACCTYWNHALKIVTAVAPRFKNVIMLPSTYQLSCTIDNVMFFARDKYESLEIMPHAKFCHDMAFYIKPKAEAFTKPNGYIFRTDKESCGKHAIPERNFDLSLAGNHYSNPKPFFDEIAQYQCIYTDRLHVAIAGCLLGREVHLYPNDYFKNKALFRTSLQNYFPNVHFHETGFHEDVQQRP